MDTKLVDHWNKNSKRIPSNKDMSPYAVDKENFFPKNAYVCDLGGGMGADAIYFLKKGHRVTLLDISDYQLNIATRSAEKNGFSNNFQVNQVDLSEGKIPESDETFDVVFSRLALHYFRKGTLTSLFREIYRILKQGGAAFISVKSANDKKEMNFLRKTSKEIEDGIFEEGGILKVRFTDRQLKNILEEAGIANFEVSEYKEQVGGRNDVIKSGNTELLLTDITIRKSVA